MLQPSLVARVTISRDHPMLQRPENKAMYAFEAINRKKKRGEREVMYLVQAP